MKLFQSHKVVEAGCIVMHTDRLVIVDNGDGSEARIKVPEDFAARGEPSNGDYLVRYLPDGYLSWSPKAVFEAGYSLIEDKPTTWQERAVLELNELHERTMNLGKALLKGVIADEQVKALMQAQYKAMVAYHDALSMRLRVCGVIDAETPPHVRVYGEQRAEVRANDYCGAAVGDLQMFLASKPDLPVFVLAAIKDSADRMRGDYLARRAAEDRGTPACVEVTVSAPAGKRAHVSMHFDGAAPVLWTVAEGQTQSWSVTGSEKMAVSQADTSTVAHKRETD